MVTEPLLEPAAVASFPGGPFTTATIQAAAAALRARAQWHIAPEVTETLTLDHDGSGVVLLPSLRVVDVVSVTNLAGPTPVVLTGWRWSKAGMLAGRFPAGFRVLQVVLTHGYPECPQDLLPAIVDQVTGGRVRQESLGSASFSYESQGSDPVSAYSLHPRNAGGG